MPSKRLSKKQKPIRKSRPHSPQKSFFSSRLFGLTFKKPRLLEAALFHPSYRNETAGLEKSLPDFDRLEFLGDAILNLIICQKIYRLYPKADEGLLSRLRSILVSRKILSRLAVQIGLPRYLKLGRSLKSQPDIPKTKIFADAFEALLAALFFDKGFSAAERFILKIFTPYFDARRLLRLDPNPKSTLQELVQRYWQRLPEYTSEATPRGFKITVAADRTHQASGIGPSKRDAEEKAARSLVRMLRHELAGRLKKKSSGKKLFKTS